jgi:hypothetical protein
MKKSGSELVFQRRGKDGPTFAHAILTTDELIAQLSA